MSERGDTLPLVGSLCACGHGPLSPARPSGAKEGVATRAVRGGSRLCSDRRTGGDHPREVTDRRAPTGRALRPVVPPPRASQPCTGTLGSVDRGGCPVPAHKRMSRRGRSHLYPFPGVAAGAVGCVETHDEQRSTAGRHTRTIRRKVCDVLGKIRYTFGIVRVLVYTPGVKVLLHRAPRYDVDGAGGICVSSLQKYLESHEVSYEHETRKRPSVNLVLQMDPNL